MGNKGFSSLPALIILTLVLLAGVTFYNAQKRTNTSVQEFAHSTPAATDTSIKNAQDSLFKSFLNDSYPQYPELTNKIPKGRIKNVFPISLRNTNGGTRQGWIIEASSSDDQNTLENIYFLLTPDLQKELTEATSTVSDDKSGSCILNNVKEVYIGKDNYVILASDQCSGYGTSGSGSTSIYNTSTGEKIKFQGSFSIANMSFGWKPVSKSGNVLGIFRNVYGTDQPTIVIDYLDYNDQVIVTAYFDLLTGKLNQIVRFN